MPYCTPLPYTKVHQYVNVSQTEDDLKAAIATQPVSVAVVAAATSWQFYSGGVFEQDCDGELDHGVLAVSVAPLFESCRSCMRRSTSHFVRIAS